jgi:tetratricopeptide (TPR) repeat protein
MVDLAQVMGVLARAIDPLVFYAPFLELLVELGKGDIEMTVRAYEDFVTAYSRALAEVPRAHERIGAARDGLADYYVSVGKLDEAEALFQRRHEEDRGDVAVALSASRAFLAVGSVSHAVRWLGVGADRATELGRGELATRLREKLGRVRARLS